MASAISSGTSPVGWVDASGGPESCSYRQKVDYASPAPRELSEPAQAFGRARARTIQKTFLLEPILKRESSSKDAAELGLARRILFGILAGAALGQVAFLVQGGEVLVRAVAHPVGTIWLNLLLVMMLPLASSALVLGVLGLEPREVGRIGLRALALTVVLTGIAVVVGLSAVALVQPGTGVDPHTLPAAAVGSAAPIRDPVQLVIAQFPSNIVAAASSNNLVPVLIFAVLFGLALRATKSEGAAMIVKLVEGVFEVSARAVHMVLRLAPIGVAALTFEMAGKGGLEALLPVARFAGTVLLALSVQMFIVYPLTLRFIGKYAPLDFFRAIRPAMAVAFSTASSAATLPTSLEIGQDRLGLNKDAARFVLTVGATANQNGTALFEGLAVVFFAQLYGVDLELAQQAGIVAVAVLAGVGTAGVPAGSLPVITALLVTLGIPEQAIGIIVGVDRLLDMARTTLNVTGDLVIAATVSGRERAPDDNAL